MFWNRAFATSMHLNDGRTLSNLTQAREFIIDLTRIDCAVPHRAKACEILARAAASWCRYQPGGDAGDPVPRARRLEVSI